MSAARRALAVAAASIAIGTATYTALQDAAQQEGATKKEMCQEIRSLDGQRFTGFVATNGPLPGKAHGDYILGDCAQGVCDYPGTDIKCNWQWTYERLANVQGYRLFRFYAPKAIAKGLKTWATETGGVHWFGSLKQIKAACLGRFTGAQCLELLGTWKHWKLANGNICHNGIEYGPGIGERTDCGAAIDAEPYAAHSDHGARGADIDSNYEYTEEE